MQERRSARRPVPPGAEWVQRYSPLYLGPLTWDAVRPFVASCAGELGLAPGRSSQRTVRLLAWAGAWALSEGMELDPEVVLDPDNVERFITTQLGAQRSWATYRSELRRVAPLLTCNAPWAPRAGLVARRRVAPPYSASEMAGLGRDTLSQSTPGRCRAARALLALGAGAGLDGRWAAKVTGADVAWEHGVLVVKVGEPAARAVPVLARWEAEVAALAKLAGAESLAGGPSSSPNQASALVASVVVGHGHPRLVLVRLRSTWLVEHLGLGARLPELARAAGLQGVEVLSELMAYVPAVKGPEALAMLRGDRWGSGDR